MPDAFDVQHYDAAAFTSAWNHDRISLLRI